MNADIFFLVSGLNAMLQGFPSNDAYALCTFAYSAGPGAEPVLFEGTTDGRIVPCSRTWEFWVGIQSSRRKTQGKRE